jgi:hypothetical protein
MDDWLNKVKQLVWTRPLQPEIMSLRKHYTGKLTDDVVQDAYYSFRSSTLIDPEYLLLSAQGMSDLNEYLQHAYNIEPKDNGDIRPLVMYQGLHVIALPTMPSGTFSIGILVPFREGE